MYKTPPLFQIHEDLAAASNLEAFLASGTGENFQIESDSNRRSCHHTPVWKRQEGSKNLQRIPTPWGLLGGQYKAFQAIFEILQRKDSKICPDFGHKYQFLCQNMSLKASNPKMIVQNVACNEKMHIFFNFGLILSTILDFSFLWQT